MYDPADIRRIHLEMTTRCNAACPMCSRNERGGFMIHDLPDAELSLEDVRTLLPPEFIRQLNQVWLCGNYGDPIVAQETLDVVRYLRTSHPGLRIGMNTNGSARTTSWWQEAASIIDLCHFGIDGLADTNHLYRRRTSWDLIMENAASFINAGGSATWEYIVFRHNEHQIETARELAESMGFKRFRVRKTGRFFFGGELQNSLAIMDESGAEIYHIEPPAASGLLNTSSAELSDIAQSPGGYKEYLDRTTIDCKAQREAEIYVSAEGLVFPCCYLASFYRGKSRRSHSQFSSLLERHGGKDAINGKRRSIDEVLRGSIFQVAVPNSWSATSVANGRLAVCSSACGAVSPTKGQYTKSLI
jgi:MoaA/NifB/PqqE/SkfB family radical SAM enzyme